MASQGRVACVRVPRFAMAGDEPAGAGAGALPPWDAAPVALSHGARLRVVSAAAAAAGVRPGMTIPQATAILGALEVRPWDEPAIRRRVTRATAAFLAASPQVSPVPGAPGTWWVGAAGFDGLGGERRLRAELERIARAWHPDARAAIADSCVAARAATWALPARRIVPPGGDRAFLARAPLSLLPLDDDLRAATAALGLRTIGQLAALDAGALEARFGPAGVAAWRLARGLDDRRPALLVPSADPRVETDLAGPADSLEPVLFLVRAAVDRLARHVAAAQRAIARLDLTLVLEGRTGFLVPAAGERVTRPVVLHRAVARAEPLFEQCRAVLEGWVLERPVTAVAVTVTETAPLPAEQGDLLAPSWRDPAAAEAALARLQATLGPGTVLRPVARDEHAPERGGAWVEGREAPPVAGPRAPAGDAPRPAALRLLEAPEPVEVEYTSHATCVLWWRGRRWVIAAMTGPERLSGDWWRAPYARDYWRCEREDGVALLVYRDQLREGTWFVQGWWD